MIKAPVASIAIVKYTESDYLQTQDLLAVEEPMEIRLQFGEGDLRKEIPISVTMRTPGNDFELALGFLFTEGIITKIADVSQISYCNSAPENGQNIIKVSLNDNLEIDLQKLQRNFYTSSSCGVCGKASIDAIKQHCNRIEIQGLRVDPNLLLSLPDKLASVQTVFKHTGGIHASALFDWEGNLLIHREDVGRHNALDKLIGYLISNIQIKTEASILLLSGRASFELVQKAAMARIPIIAAVGAPSSLAVETAKNFGIQLFGFLRENRFNKYA